LEAVLGLNINPNLCNVPAVALHQHLWFVTDVWQKQQSKSTPCRNRKKIKKNILQIVEKRGALTDSTLPVEVSHHSSASQKKTIKNART
jgi:hypothetical protein